MAYEFYCSIEATKQGKLKGESPRETWKEKMGCLTFDYAVISPRDAATGQASGKRTHQQLVITKEWGASSPQLFQACVTNEVLKSVLLEFVRTNANGEEYVHHTIKLTNASVAKHHQFIKSDAKNDGKHDVHELEEISFSFQKIEIENKDGKTMAADDWHKN